MATKLLLVDDVEHVGRSGDIVSVKSGFARNFLLPKGFAVTADKRALNMQAKLQEERLKRAAEDRKDAELIAKKFEGVTITTKVKVDEEGHMYGSVTQLDVIHLVEKELGLVLEKKSVDLKHPIKKLGTLTIPLKFKEEVECEFTLNVISENAPEVKEEDADAEVTG